MLLDSKMNLLLLLTPLAFASAGAGWPAGVTFLLALLPLCSLAEVSSMDPVCRWDRRRGAQQTLPRWMLQRQEPPPPAAL